MRRSSELAGSRREFFRATARGGLLALLGLVAVVTGRRSGAENQRCVNRGICSGCGVFEACGLPQALSAKAARGGPGHSRLGKPPSFPRASKAMEQNENPEARGG